ncbi:MAG: lamin tail domain-containing protein [Candidatus Izemoplasmatales bacterium]|nr:lamin tail domain-containing protein [Candidatus Izemoplasmatales bacterium]
MRKLLITFSLILALFGSSVIVNAAVQKGTVNISSTLDGEVLTNGSDSQIDIGSVMTLDATTIDDSNEFAFWIVNGFVRTDLPAETQLRVQSKMNLVAVFRSADKHAVLFVDSNGKLIDDVYVADGETATAPSTDGLTKPGGLTVVANEANRWISLEGNTSLADINSSRVYVLQYEMDATAVEIMAIGALTEEFTANKNDVVTVVAADTTNFKYWADDEGNVLSYNPTYSFTVLGATTIEAIEEGESVTAESFVKMTDLTGIRVGYESYMGRVELHGEDELVEFGFIMSTTEVGAITHESTGVIVSKSNAYNPATGEFLMSFPLVNFLSIRAYAIIDNGTELVYIYNELPGSFASDLFISEYLEAGSGNNKAIEIYNGTGSVVDLSIYSVNLYSNGASTASNTITLVGELAHGEVYVIGNSGATADMSQHFDTTSTVTYFNGDDAIALLKNGSVIDVLGVIGSDPGSAWTWDGGSTMDTVLVRSSNVNGPKDEWNSAEWDVYPDGTLTYLGSHTMDGASVTLTDSQSILLDAMNIGEFGPIKADGTITLPLTGANGTTISWASDAEHIIDPSTKEVIIPSGAPETVTLTATISKGGLSKSVTRNVLVGLTYEERVLADKEALVLEVTTISEAGNFTLPTTGEKGSTISWESNNSLIVVDNVTGTATVTLPASGSVDVTLTATIAFESESDEKLFTVEIFAGGSVLSSVVAFGTGNSSASNVSKTNFLALWNDRASDDLDLVEAEIKNILKVYTYATLGQNDNLAIKVGSSKVGGVALDIEFSRITIQSIVINARVYGTDAGVKLIVNGVESDTLTSADTNYNFNISGNVLNLTLEGKRAYINSITFNYTVNP